MNGCVLFDKSTVCSVLSGMVGRSTAISLIDLSISTVFCISVVAAIFCMEENIRMISYKEKILTWPYVYKGIQM